MKLTKDLLEYHGVPSVEITRFEQLFPEGTEMTPAAMTQMAASHINLRTVIKFIVSDTEWSLYIKQETALYYTHNIQIMQARREYNDNCDALLKKYKLTHMMITQAARLNVDLDMEWCRLWRFYSDWIEDSTDDRARAVQILQQKVLTKPELSLKWDDNSSTAPYRGKALTPYRLSTLPLPAAAIYVDDVDLYNIP